MILICNCLSDGSEFIIEIGDDGASVFFLPCHLSDRVVSLLFQDIWLIVGYSWPILKLFIDGSMLDVWTEELPGSFLRQNQWSIIVQFDNGRVIMTISGRTPSSKIFPETLGCLCSLVPFWIHNRPRLRQVIVE